MGLLGAGSFHILLQGFTNSGELDMAMQHKKLSGFSENEIFYPYKLGLEPSQLCLGNSVVAVS